VTERQRAIPRLTYARTLLVWAAVAVSSGLAAGAGAVQPPPGVPSPVPRQLGPAAAASELPLLRVHRYRMAGRIRPLLFWIGRDDVGLGEIVWRRGPDGVGYELLIGTDSAKAPRGINRWGYLREDSRPSGTRVLGVMTTSDEATLKDVTNRPGGPQAAGRFKGLDARIAAGVSRSASETLEPDRDFSVRDKDLILERIEPRLRDAPLREVSVPRGVRQGFLLAVAELVDDTVAAAGSGGAQALRRLRGRTIPYVYSRTLYDLELTAIGPSGATPAARGAAKAVRAGFETTNRTTGNRTTFELEYATEGALAGVPTLIRHQPRWWLQAVLALVE
jgi:hypothetical protein